MQAFPQVKAEAIPRQVWEQVARGMPLVSAYAMHENERLRVELAAERQDRTTGCAPPVRWAATPAGSWTRWTECGRRRIEFRVESGD